MSHLLQKVTTLLLAASLGSIGSVFASGELSFSKDIRPILSANCFKCHGPDDQTREEDLRLDIADSQDWQKIIARITSSDPDEIMPPPEANKTLKPAQITLLKTWIDQGAKYEKHWAFIPPQKSTIPSSSHPIDHLYKIPLAPKADPHTLIRRLHLDLIGLPPTIEVADRFAADPSPEAYAAIVDDLLSSPRYGERWARRWLDLARYADTNGYEKDRDRSIWPYRDYVIRSLNADKPFDQFTIEQLAGDMLENPTPDQLIATGFHRNTMLNEEGGIDPLEFRYHAMTDRVATTGTTWLGLTTGCAQCHTHKYDPITHHDYFGLMAYLNNTSEPDYHLPDPSLAESQKANLAQAQKLLAELPSRYPADKNLQADHQAWLATQQPHLTPWQTLTPTKLHATTPYLTLENDNIIFAAGDVQKLDTYTLEFPPQSQPLASLRLEALTDPRLPGRGPGMTYYEGKQGDFFLSEITITSDKNHPIKSSSQAQQNNAKGYNSIHLAHDSDIQTGWKPGNDTGINHLAVFNFTEAIPAGTPITITLTFSRHYPVALGKFRLSASPSPDIRALAHTGTLTDFLLQTPDLKSQADQIHTLQKPLRGTPTLIMRERPAAHTRPTHLRHRGEYTQPKERVSPRLPDALFPSGKPYPKDRLAFAKWLVSKENPLTARVVVNRHWAAFFGTGIVPSLDDFGMQGKLPTNPQLLDHLAVTFIENGWSLKHLHRLIVTSAAYQQDSKIESQTSHQFPRQRLEAEVIRDAALQASGLLSDKMFGPPVRPPQPQGVSEVAYGNPKWNPSKGEDRFRRSIYTYQKRTAPFAFLTTFDASSGEACLARRDRSNTPLQALTLMNDPMFIEIAQHFGQRLEKSPGSTEEKITQAFRLLLTRPPTKTELQHLTTFHQKHQSFPALTRALLSLDESVTKP
ncbi:MAG: PSD1 and planctomycete cytochrome C domain-containing protein [Verrucomicrobiaceae bacterium]